MPVAIKTWDFATSQQGWTIINPIPGFPAWPSFDWLAFPGVDLDGAFRASKTTAGVAFGRITWTGTFLDLGVPEYGLVKGIQMAQTQFYRMVQVSGSSIIALGPWLWSSFYIGDVTLTDTFLLGSSAWAVKPADYGHLYQDYLGDFAAPPSTPITLSIDIVGSVGGGFASAVATIDNVQVAVPWIGNRSGTRMKYHAKSSRKTSALTKGDFLRNIQKSERRTMAERPALRDRIRRPKDQE